MTAEDWKTVDKALKSVLLPGVKLLIDGYEVTLTLCQNHSLKTLLQYGLTEVLKANGLQKIVRNAGVSSAVRREHLLKKQIIRLMAYAVRKLKKN